MDTLTKYFELSDIASTDSKAFIELIGLFADDATIVDNRGHEYNGRDQIKTFFKNFFQSNVKLRHVFSVKTNNDNVTVGWAVAGQKDSGKVFALSGTDHATLDKDNKIKQLHVISNN